MLEYTDLEELKNVKIGQKLHNNLKNLLSSYPPVETYEKDLIIKGKLENLYSIYEFSQKLQSNENINSKNLGEEVHILLADSLFRRRAIPLTQESDSRKPINKSPFPDSVLVSLASSPRFDHIMKELRALGLENNKLVKSFLDGTLKDYVKTEEGEKELEKLAKDKELFQTFLKVLKIKGAVEIMVDFLKTKEGIESYIEVGKTQAGLEVFIKLGQVSEGRMVAMGLLKSPIYGWPAIYKILRGLGSHTKTVDNAEEGFPSFSLKPFLNSKDPAAEILPLLSNPKFLGDIFLSFSESKENSKLCCKLLENKEVRKVIFNYIVGNNSLNETFTRLLQSKERRDRMSEIFMSKGGTKLLSELAGNIEGRALMTHLAISDNGRKIGIDVLLHHPLTIVKVGFNYFRDPFID